MRHLVKEGFSKCPEKDSPEYQKRIEEELTLIDELNLASSFLIQRDIINLAKNNGITVGPSHGGSRTLLVCYLAGINEIDPLKFALTHELTSKSPNRSNYFYFEVTCCQNNQEKLVELIFARYRHCVTREKKDGANFDNGVMEINISGQHALSINSHCLNLVKSKKKIDRNFDFSQINEKDEKLFACFAKGDTADIFLLEHATARYLLTNTQPATMNDLLNIITICWPHIIGNPAIPLNDYIGRCNGDRFYIMHPAIFPILEETHGFLIYKSQAIKIIKAITGCSLFEADQTRRQIRKQMFKEERKHENSSQSESIYEPVIEEVPIEKEFIKNAVANGYTHNDAKMIYRYILKSDSYYLKDIMVYFTIVAYRIAYLKYYFPKEFTASKQFIDSISI